MPPKKRYLSSPTSPSPLRLRTLPPRLPVIRLPPLTNNSSPDLFEPFVYTPDMDPDLHRIDSETSDALGNDDGHSTTASEGDIISDSQPSTPVSESVLDSESRPPTPPQSSKTWVVFVGKKPGIYSDLASVTEQVRGFKGGFQRVYHNRTSATNAWEAFNRDGSFPGYGKAPWVVLHGRKPGVVEKVSELETAVSGCDEALYHSCSSVAEAKDTYRRYVGLISEIFKAHKPGSSNEKHPSSAAAEKPPPKQAESSSVVAEVDELTPAPPEIDCINPPLVRAMAPRVGTPDPGNFQCWYVVYRGVLPGVCYGSDELRIRGPEPGGFESAFDRDSANAMFLYLATTKKVTRTLPKPDAATNT